MAIKSSTLVLTAVLLLVICSIVVIEYKLNAFQQESSSLQIGKPAKPPQNNQAKSELPVVSRNSEVLQLNKDSAQLAVSGNFPNPTQKSRYAYVTLISGIDLKFKYRGFLYNALIMHRALETQGSTADFIALIGYSVNDTTPFQDDINLLKSHGIIVHELARLVDPNYPLRFAEMALLKITPYSFVQYEKVQFFDGDVMPTKNMDCFFELQHNAFTIGAVSPLNSGWYMAIPDQKAFEVMREKAIWRLFREWDEQNGWGEPLPEELTVRGGRPVSKPKNRWNFNGADMDQGLFTHYFVINHGNALLMDAELKVVRLYRQGLAHDHKHEEVSTAQALSCCHSAQMPTSYFAHFTGRSKPWMVDLRALTNSRKHADLVTWTKLLDSMQLPGVNSSTINDLKLGSPLGFFNVNFPKGGYKKQST